MKPKASFAVLASGLVLAAGQASAVTITFENLAAGTTLSNQYAGVTFSANAFTGAGGPNGDWATNTDMTIVSSLAGGDVGGVGTPSLVSGNVLHSFSGWLIEDGDPSFRVSFAAPINTFSAAFAGVSTPPDVRLSVYNGAALIGIVTGAVTTGQFVLSFAAASFTSVVITPGSFNDWVAVDNINYTAAVIPEASTYAMMGAGLALLALRRRKMA